MLLLIEVQSLHEHKVPVQEGVLHELDLKDNALLIETILPHNAQTFRDLKILQRSAIVR